MNFAARAFDLRILFGAVYTARMCGHRTKRFGKISARGDSTFLLMKTDGGFLDYCFDCLAEMTIACAWCERPIFIGQTVMLSSPREGEIVPKGGVRYSEDTLLYVGCLRWECAFSPLDYHGYWEPGTDFKGHVRFRDSLAEIVPSPLPLPALAFF